MPRPDPKSTSDELHYIAGLCELAANGIGAAVDWEQVSKDLRGFAAEFEALYTALVPLVGRSGYTGEGVADDFVFYVAVKAKDFRAARAALARADGAGQ